MITLHVPHDCGTGTFDLFEFCALAALALFYLHGDGNADCVALDRLRGPVEH